MNTEEIKKLLEKYYNAECSKDEEQILKRFFAEEDVPEELLYEKEIFVYFDESASVPEPAPGFEERIIAAIDASGNTFSVSKRRKLWITISGIAAGVLILTGSYFFFTHRTGNSDTFSDPEAAYAEAMKILYNVSIRLNQGTRSLGTVALIQDVPAKSLETINKSTTIIEDKLKAFDYFNKAMEIVNGK